MNLLIEYFSILKSITYLIIIVYCAIFVKLLIKTILIFWTRKKATTSKFTVTFLIFVKFYFFNHFKINTIQTI